MNRPFERTAPGQKTTAMLRVETKLGRTLEEDYQEFYLKQGWGQRRLPKRWGVDHNTVFQSRETLINARL